MMMQSDTQYMGGVQNFSHLIIRAALGGAEIVNLVLTQSPPVCVIEQWQYPDVGWSS